MPLFAKTRSFLRNLLSRRHVDAELDSELHAHLDLLTDENLRAGMGRPEAERAARLELGGVEQVKEQVRHRRLGNWLQSVFGDVRYALRQLRKNPGFTAVAILTLALGIGANTAIFSVVDGVLLRSLPYRDPGRLVMVWERNSESRNPYNTVSPPNFLDWQARNSVFSGMAYVCDVRNNLTGQGDPEEVVVQAVSANFFSVLGVEPILGSGFTPENGIKGHDDVVVLGFGLWQRRFAGDPNIIGKSILLNGKPQTVVGVAPENYTWLVKDGSLTGEKPQIWTPFVFPPAYAVHKNMGRFISVVARLKPDVTLTAARSQMKSIASQLEIEYPDADRHWGVNVVPMAEQVSGSLRPALLVLFGAVFFVLLIACANLSGLLLARAGAREREIAVRSAIGASPWRITRQLLIESMVLAILGGATGIALAVWGTNALLAASPSNLLDLRAVPLNARVLSFSTLCTLTAGLLFGFVPSYFTAWSRSGQTLREAGRGTSATVRSVAARNVFVVAQLSLALVLLVGSGLLIRSFIRLVAVEPGFQVKNLLTFKVTLPEARYATDPARVQFFQQFLAKIAAIPGVSSVSMESFPPLTGLGAATDVHLLSQPVGPHGELPVANVRVVGADYLRTMGISLHAGRFFTTQELQEEKHVTIVNEAFVEKYLNGAEPLRQKAAIYMKSLTESELVPSEVIGVVGDVHQMGLDSMPDPTVYWPHPELVMSQMTILARTSGDPMVLVPAIRDELHQLDRELPMASIASMEQLLADSLARSRFTMLLLGLFAAFALLLAAIGIYGLLAYSVIQRTQELGVRIALGAQMDDILRLVLTQGARLVAAGAVFGTLAAVGLSQLMKSLLFDVEALDPLTLTAVPLFLALIALAACYLPARRATRVDPMVALRYE